LRDRLSGQSRGRIGPARHAAAEIESGDHPAGIWWPGSLLSGLLFDEIGNRLTPTHTNRQGKRYRYYARQSRQGRKRGRPHDAERSWRIPATEIEKAVIDRLAKQLTDHQWLLKNCNASEGKIAARRSVVTRAKELADRIGSESRGALREILLMLLSQVTLGVSEIRIDIRRPGLTAALGSAAHMHLEGASPLAPSTYTKTAEVDGVSVNDTLSISIPMKLRRRGAETKLIVDASGNGSEVTVPDPARVKMIANAHQWWEDLIAHRFHTMRALAATYGKDERYVARVLQLAFLVPATVDAQSLLAPSPLR
jgi:hypothetical protein